MTPEQRAALLVLREQIADSIDGAEEYRGHDVLFTRWCELCDIALGNPVDHWALLFHLPAIRAEQEAMTKPSIKEQMGKV